LSTLKKLLCSKYRLTLVMVKSPAELLIDLQKRGQS
jgi:hypothetical protein